MKLIDTHCHLNFKAFAGDYLDVAKNSAKNGIENLIIPGAGVESSKSAVEVCRKINVALGKKFAHPAVGVHPIHEDESRDFAKIEKLAELPEVVAIGECGMDKFHEKNEAEISKQKELFARHIKLAGKLGKPLIVHNREADEEILEVLTGRRGLYGGDCPLYGDCPRISDLKMVFHCFSSDWKFAQTILDLGAYISFTGNITYGNKKLKKVIERVPLERVMLDTDSPYLVPEPERSEGIKRNEPKYIVRVAERIAYVKNLDLDSVCSQTTENAKKFFGI